MRRSMKSQMVPMTSSRIDRCMLCGLFEPIERDHIIRRANSDETWPIGSVCHHRYVTQRQDEQGVTPGLDPHIARPGGYGIYLTLIMEQHGLTEFADMHRIAESYWSQLHGKPARARHKPRRLAQVTVTDPDERIIMQDICELLSDMFTRQAPDNRLPQHARDDCELFARYLQAARNNPGVYYEYQLQRSDFAKAITVIDKTLRRMACHRIPADDIRDELIGLLRNEAISFLRHV